jgi:predicted nucleic acid-binding protein
MASVVADAGFIVALLSRRDSNHAWAVAQASRHPPPWATCEAALSEAAHLLGKRGAASFAELVRRGALFSAFCFGDDVEAVLKLLEKYTDVPMSFADACLVRMSETLNEPLILTTDGDFRVYRRHGRQAVPYVLPK